MGWFDRGRLGRAVLVWCGLVLTLGCDDGSTATASDGRPAADGAPADRGRPDEGRPDGGLPPDDGVLPDEGLTPDDGVEPEPCRDGVRGPDEEGVDCGGPCPACPDGPAPLDPSRPTGTLALVDHVVRAQVDLQPEALTPRRVSSVRGRVTDQAGEPIAGAAVRARGQAAVGFGLSDAEGDFEFVFNGGGTVVIEITAEGFLPLQRHVARGWGSLWAMDDVVLTALDPAVTVVPMGGAAPAVHVASPVEDARGARQASLLFKPGTAATMRLPDGSEAPLDQLSVRVSEYTVGDRGRLAMPGPLDPGVLYTYAAELSVDEAMAAGAVSVTFDPPVAFHLDNFLDAPVGVVVPAGTYDREQARWLPDADGHTFGVVAIEGELATLDLDGDGVADPGLYADFGVDDAERAAIAQRFGPGDSLWRVLRSHFSPVDCNFAGLVFDANPPPGWFSNDGYGGLGGPGVRSGAPPWCQSAGSIIECQSQVLGEQIPVAGAAPLTYRSDRARGHTGVRTVDVPVTDRPRPAYGEVVVDLNIAGQQHQRAFVPDQAHTWTFEWDGLDRFGRPVTGAQLMDVTLTQWIEVRVPFVASSCNGCAGGNDAMFGLVPPANADGGPAAGVTVETQTIRIPRSHRRRVAVGRMTAEGVGLGGWTYPGHHLLDPVAGALLRGDGSQIQLGSVESVGFPVQEGPVQAMAGLPDGSVALLLGGPTVVLAGDTIREIELPETPDHVAGLPNGELLVAFYATGCADDDLCGYVRRYAPDGSSVAVLGDQTRCLEAGGCGDGEPAAQSPVAHILDMAPGPDGSLWFLETGDNVDSAVMLRQVRPDGTLRTLTDPAGALIADGGVIRSAHLGRSLQTAFFTHLTVGDDGTVYVAVPGDRFRDPADLTRPGPSDAVYAVALDGRTRRVLGGAEPPGPDVAPADSRLGAIDALLVRDGVLYALQNETRWGAQRALVALEGDGLRVADGDLFTASERCVGRGLAQTPAGIICRTEGLPGQGQRFLVIGGEAPTPTRAVPDPDRGELHEFDGGGRHLATRALYTGQVLRRFEYDAGGRLSAVVSPQGQVVFERNADGALEAVVGWDGARTQVALDDAGRLASLRGPEGREHRLEYRDGLLAAHADPAGRRTAFEYGARSRLVADEAPDGGRQVLRREAEGEGGFRVVHTTAAGRATQHVVTPTADGTEVRRVDAAGVETVHHVGTESRLELPSGTVITQADRPHPLWGAPALNHRSTITTPAGLRLTVARDVVADYGPDPFAAFPDNLEAVTTTVTAGGRTTVEVQRLTAEGTELVRTAPSGRAHRRVYDLHGDLVQDEAPGLAPRALAWADGSRWLEAVSQGDQSVRYTRDGAGRVTAQVNALGHTERWTYDQAGALTRWTTRAGDTFAYGHDAAGELASMTTPEGHTFAVERDERGRRSALVVPALGAFEWAYDADGNEVRQTRPSGATVDTLYDAGGRPAGWVTAAATDTFEYVEGTEQLAAMIRAPAAGAAQTVRFEYDGHLTTAVAFEGPAAARVDFRYSAAQQVDQIVQAMGGQQRTLAVQRDADGLLTQVGAVRLAYDGPAPMPSAVTWGAVREALTYDALGRVAGRAFTADGAAVLSQDTTYDAAGRVVRVDETVLGEVQSRAYRYDDHGQLLAVVADPDGAAVEIEAYTYDGDGNRLTSHRGASTYRAHVLATLEGGEIATDADGSITQVGGLRLAYGARGGLLTAEVAGQTVRYGYDSLGRRTHRAVGNQTWRYAYGNPGRLWEISGVTRPDGQQVFFDYAPDGRLMGMALAGGPSYAVVCDGQGTPRVVLDAAGQAVKTLRYDAFGVLLEDSAPEVALEIGFAGGLADPLTGLVRFWHRDYLPQAGRWTALDPAFFSGDKRNLYLYAENDPVRFHDPTGLFCVGFTQYEGVGGGAKMCVAKNPLTGQWETSLCIELGVGVGGGVEISPLAGVDSTGINAMAGISVSAGPVSAGGEAKITSCGGLEGKLVGGVGNVVAEKVYKSDGSTGSDLKYARSGQPKPPAPPPAPADQGGKGKLGVEAKVALEFCVSTQ